jgi:hypothetical protein
MDRLLTIAPRESFSSGRMRASYEGAEHVYGELLLHRIEVAQIVIERDAGIVSEHVECADLTRHRLDLRNVGHVERDGSHPCVRVFDCSARSRIDSVRAESQYLIDERPADAAVSASDQYCLIRNLRPE